MYFPVLQISRNALGIKEILLPREDTSQKMSQFRVVGTQATVTCNQFTPEGLPGKSPDLMKDMEMRGEKLHTPQRDAWFTTVHRAGWHNAIAPAAIADPTRLLGKDPSSCERQRSTKLGMPVVANLTPSLYHSSTGL